RGGEDGWRTGGGTGGGWPRRGCAPQGVHLGFPICPNRHKTAVSAPADLPCVDRKSRRTFSRAVVEATPTRRYLPFLTGACFLSLPLTHWKLYLWYSGLRTFLQYWPWRRHRSPHGKCASLYPEWQVLAETLCTPPWAGATTTVASAATATTAITSRRFMISPSCPLPRNRKP